MRWINYPNQNKSIIENIVCGHDCANKHSETIFLIIVLSALLFLSTRSTTLENVFAKNYNVNIIPTEDNLCRYPIPQANTVCHAYNLNVRTQTTTLAGSFLKHYDEDRADELGYDNDVYQSDNASGVGDINSSGNVMPAFVDHSHGSLDGGHYDGGNHQVQEMVEEETGAIMVVPMVEVAMIMDITMVAIAEIMIKIANIAEIVIRITTTRTYADAYQ